jgi:hypothetical protein
MAAPTVTGIRRDLGFSVVGRRRTSCFLQGPRWESNEHFVRRGVRGGAGWELLDAFRWSERCPTARNGCAVPTWVRAGCRVLPRPSSAHGGVSSDVGAEELNEKCPSAVQARTATSVRPGQVALLGLAVG